MADERVHRAAPRGIGVLLLPWLAVLLLPFAVPAAAGALEQCLECHGLRGLALPERPLWLPAEGGVGGPHAGLVCSDCHKGVDLSPHLAPRVRCDLPCHVAAKTHEDHTRAEQQGAHARVGDPPCLGCHGGEKSVRGVDSDALCRRCHVALDRPRRVYPDSPGAFGFWAHQRGAEGRRAPRCVDCHGLHPVRPARAARGACGSSGCHPGVGTGFQPLFDHRGAADPKPWGGAGTLVLAALGIVTGIALLHARRRGP